MNFVIFSRNFYPQNDPEAFCATRFASALAEVGHSVHVVAADYACDFDYKALVDSRVKITRVKVCGISHQFPCLNVRQAMVMDDDMWNVPAFCRAVKTVLREYEDPILITRALPLTSVIVGYRMRKYASKWISHFSDPIPWFPLGRKIFRIKDFLTRRWVGRAIAAADAISVTCPLAVRYYQETYPDAARGKKFVVTLHIGDNKLDRTCVDNPVPVFARRIILHPGDMYYGRGEAIFKAVDQLNAQGDSCLFVLDRPPWPDMALWFRESPNSVALATRGGGRLNENISANAAVIFVPDFVREFEYSPYLMSKFVYQVYGNCPIVVHAKKESCMADFCRRYPDAGLYFSEAGNVDSLVTALRAAFACDVGMINRTEVRREFSSDAVARSFVHNIETV